MNQIASIQGARDSEFTIGTHPDCDIALASPIYQPYISTRHAALRRKGKNYFVRDLESAQGTYVNGFKIGKKWVRIALHDEIFLGSCPFKVAGLILKEQQISLQARHLTYSIPTGRGDRRRLASNISFTVGAGELIGILGPSGSGKTVLLNLLSGAVAPTTGDGEECGVVTVNERFSLRDEKDLLKDFIGYVPQDDVLIPELTVEQSLGFSLELKYSDSGIERSCKEKRIKETVEKLGFFGEKKENFLKTRIGSADTSRGLSGGERRKANIAHELIKKPLLLFLDEPTSGLSSVDADNIITLLRKICDADRTTTIMTVHQPSASSFVLLDKVLILNFGGKVAYYGPPGEAVQYFQKQSGKKLENRNPAEFILEALDQWSKSRLPEEAFLASEQVKEVMPQSTWSPQAGMVHTVCRGTAGGVVRQFVTLLRRTFCVASAEWENSCFQVLQPILIASLILLCFFGYEKDYHQEIRDERIIYHVVQNSGQGLSLTRHNLEVASAWADDPANGQFLDVGSANRIGAIYFLLIISAIWIGIINTCREIVGEKAVLEREGRSGLRMSSYLLAKLAYFGTLGSLQVGAIVLGIKAGLLSDMPTLYIWGILSLTAVYATCLGLALSGLVTTQRMALTAVPLILIPQLLFGGLVRPIKFISSGFGWVHHLMLQKWAFLAALLGESTLGIQVLSKVADFKNYDVTKRLAYHQETLAEMYFGASVLTNEALQTALLVIAGQGLAVFLLAYVLIRIKYSG